MLKYLCVEIEASGLPEEHVAPTQARDQESGYVACPVNFTQEQYELAR